MLAAAALASIEMLWRGEAKLELVRQLTIDSAAGAGWVVVDGTRWHWFYRDAPAAPRPAACPSDYTRTVVRTSSDGGASWSAQVVVAEPAPGTCTTLDGANAYDPATGIWHLLAQCLARADEPGGQHWNLCHFTRAGDPAGAYVPDPANPVVRGGDLFSRLCALPGAQCPPGVVDEGTPEVLGRDTDGAFLVSFHGARYASNNVIFGFRAAARTRDFRHFEISGGALPGDVMLSARDCASVTKGCIGVGAATTLRGHDGYWYQLAETPNVSLGCVPGQDWPFTLFRAPRLAPSGGWELPTAAPVPLLKAAAPGVCPL